MAVFWRELFKNPVVLACYVIIAYAVVLPHLVRNVTASLPPGWYWCVPQHDLAPLAPDTLTLFTPTVKTIETVRAVVPTLLVQVPWMKRTLGQVGDIVCATGDTITVNNVQVATRPLRAQYPFPPLEQCWKLGPDDLFVVGEHPKSIDSRYFGLVPRVSIHATCTPLWTWEAPHE